MAVASQSVYAGFGWHGSGDGRLEQCLYCLTAGASSAPGVPRSRRPRRRPQGASCCRLQWLATPQMKLQLEIDAALTRNLEHYFSVENVIEVKHIDKKGMKRI